jgi:ABC-type multidrug transport system fused ATPase/permease subunit
MTDAPCHLLWPVDRLPDALEQLALRAGYGGPLREWSRPDPAVEPSRVWMGALAGRLGVELEPVVPLYRELPHVVRRAAPAVLQLRRDGRPYYLILVGAHGSKVRLLATDSSVRSARVDYILQLLREEKQASVAADVDRLLAGIRTSNRARARVRTKMLLQRLGQRELRTGWIMRPLPTAGTRTLLGNTPLLLAGILVNHFLLSMVLAGSFWMLGRAALQARLDMGWFEGWIALVASSIPLRLLEVWWQGIFSMRVGGLLKQQLLAGILKLTPDEIRLDGVGRHFGRVAESEVVELLALGGGLLAILSIVDLVMAAAILWRGAGGSLQVTALVAWTVLAVVLTVRHYTVQRRWSTQRIDITHDLLERMLGHRTRLAQLPLDRWHDAEDRHLSQYSETSKGMDVRTMNLSAILPGGWLVVALLTLTPAFAVGRAPTSSLAISVGGVLLALRAFDEIAVFFQQLSLAGASFEQIRGLLEAVARPELASKVPLEMEASATRTSGPQARAPAGGESSDRHGTGPQARGPAGGESSDPYGTGPQARGPAGGESSDPYGTEEEDAATDCGSLVEARGLTFRHQTRTRPILENCSLQIARGDRILLEGPSGGGKSTLVALLTGMRTPDAGVLLFRGLDRATLGLSGWRRRVTAAPQFHENHVLSGSFAYNLLLGREWPVSAASREEARVLCEELGLDDLIAKMPSGLDEMIGETGWQLSHGEKSRLYIARTLLQGGELVILDESFASLDPETMVACVRCVLKHAPSVLVVSHP